jgi:hypothetical protein
MPIASTIDPNRMLTTAEAANLLGLQPCTLAAWREDGSQPDLSFSKFGKAVRYRYGDLIGFIEARRASSTLTARQLKAAEPAPAAPRKPRRSKETGRGANGQQSLF